MRNRLGICGIAAALVLMFATCGCGETGSGEAGPVPKETTAPSGEQGIPTKESPAPRV